MSNTKPQFDMGYVIIALVCAGIFGLIYIISLFQEQKDPQALLIAQQKWVQNDLLLNSLQRYTDAYQQLKRPEDKKILAKLYVKKITKDLLMFPAKDGSSIRVILPEQSENNTTVMVLKEIKLGTTDNGLFKAFQEVLDPPRPHQPPFYAPEIDQVMSYVMTGIGKCGDDCSLQIDVL